ncbi:unnamed protein product [Paramecium sonneborni]|uniref:Uncharacterized protein n=1 Tax=Paramecium sonneborni TaxID=65129 RepID=A0A8S1QSU8_9CILI|nr:unnamed protein product [Paramecium sonneborni]
MNIKIIYNTKTHKISQKYQTLEEIRNAIQILYPQQLQNEFDLYISLHYQIEPLKIIDEACLLKIKDLYHQLKWSSIKILVKDSINPNLTNEDLSILNQSVVSQSSVQLSTFIENFQQYQEPKPEIQQKQKIIIKEIKQEQDVTQEIINQVQKQEEFLKIDYNSEEFKQFIIQQIDERLKYHGILQAQLLKPKLPEYRMQLITKDFKLSKFINEIEQFQVQITNTGDIIWRKNNVFLCGVDGYYKNEQFELLQDVNPGEIAYFICKFQMPNYEAENLKSEFQMVYYEQGKQKSFGEKLLLVFTVKKKNNQKPNLKKINEQKIKQLMENAAITKIEAIQFIEMYGEENPIDEIILAYFDQLK